MTILCAAESSTFSRCSVRKSLCKPELPVSRVSPTLRGPTLAQVFSPIPGFGHTYD